ncbi:hypothetical protein [Limimonas halophila]|uniref:hypothetical protein n=1 Tax=Limimonas halophila TaxID=1082479 RepID=UPI0011600790|nr:hypothetical protein [Limimonas halophila]
MRELITDASVVRRCALVNASDPPDTGRNDSESGAKPPGYGWGRTLEFAEERRGQQQADQNRTPFKGRSMFMLSVGSIEVLALAVDRVHSKAPDLL